MSSFNIPDNVKNSANVPDCIKDNWDQLFPYTGVLQLEPAEEFSLYMEGHGEYQHELRSHKNSDLDAGPKIITQGTDTGIVSKIIYPRTIEVSRHCHHKTDTDIAIDASADKSDSVD
ncbi:MAG: hypothetical protein GY874_10725 [Desulfobacteraceae bacterium]|nr:hypothetical protein [Desulfobacteraceae bacterium]